MALTATFAHRVEFAALRVTVWLLSRMSFERARRMGARIGALGYWPLGIRRGVVERQIAAAFPGMSDREVRGTARAAYETLGRTAMETALVAPRGAAGVLEMFESEDDFAPLVRAREVGRGVVIVAGHLGNWELCAGYLAARGVPLEAIVRRQGNPLFDSWLNSVRRAIGVQIIMDEDAVRRSPRALRENHAVGFVADQGLLGLASTFVPFFGRPAKTPRGAAVFALRFGAPIVLVSAVLQPSGKYHMLVREIPVVDTGDREADVDATVLRWTQALEGLIRRYPEQYFWHHRRWKRQPPDTPAELREP